MIDQDKSKPQLIEELAEMRRRVSLLETADTKGRQTEVTLRESEERFRKVFEEGPLGILLVGTDGRIQHANQHFCDMLGYSENEIIALGLAGITHPDDWERDHPFVSRLWHGEISHYQSEKRYLRKDGQVVWGELTVSLMHDDAGRPINTVGMIEDITERRQAEEALRASEAKYRRLHQSMRDAFVSVDMDGFFREHNDAFRTMLGYEPEELMKLRYMDVTPDKWNPYVAEIVQNQIVSRGYSNVYEKEFRRKDGSVVPVEMRVSLLTDDDNQPCGMWAIIRNITMRKQAEQALQKAHDELEQRVKERTAELAKANENLRQSHDELRAIYDGMFDGMLVADIETERFFTANAAMARMLGYSDAELRSLSVKDIHPQADLPFVIEQFHGLAEGKIQVSEEIPVLRKDGSVFFARVTSSKVTHDARPCIVGFFRDVTERKQAEEALRQSEERLRLAQQVARVGSFEWNIQAAVSVWTPELEALHGLPPGGFAGTQEAWLSLVYSEDRPKVAQLAKRAFETGEAAEGEWRVQWPDGSIHWLAGRWQAFKDESGKPLRMLGVNIDITDRKRAEEALRQSEARFRAFVTASSDVVYNMSPDWSEMRHLQGREFIPDTNSPSHTWLEKYIHPDDQPHVMEVVNEAIRTKSTFELEHRVLRMDGTLGWTFSRAVPMLDANGEIMEWFGAASDITERKQAEKKIRQHRELLQAIIDNTPALIYVKDLEGRVTTANRALCEAAGRDMQDILGRTSRNVAAGSQDAEIRMTNDRRVIETGQAILAEESSFGRIFLSVKFPLKDAQGRVFAIGGVSTDITERTQAKEALRQSEERFRVAFEEAPLGVLMLVGDGVVVRANRTFCQMSGYSEEELIGKSIHEVTYPEDRERSERLNEQVLAGVIPSLTMEKRYLRKNEGFFWGQAAVTAVHDRGGNVIFALSIIENITERKRAQEALKKEHRNLRHMLRSSDNERQLIAYEIHDGLAQQLAGAIMQFDAFDHLKDVKPKQAADAYHAAITMLRQGHFETRRLIAGVRPPILDEAGVVEAVAHLVHEEGRDKGPKIEFHSRVDFDRLDPTLENAIYRVVQEALANACKYSKSERIWVSLLQREDRLRIEIRDWGVGFDPKTIPRNHFGVEGIRQRARLLGGKCSIQSTAGKGSRVIVTLPVVLRDEDV